MASIPIVCFVFVFVFHSLYNGDIVFRFLLLLPCYLGFVGRRRRGIIFKDYFYFFRLFLLLMVMGGGLVLLFNEGLGVMVFCFFLQ
ncbi:hypothetical protein BC829DRAFT_391565 [Chytridium lagenaria]|nr:hypothetical protein BC829DRAFT_391565 [Chytridium lagenaria]